MSDYTLSSIKTHISIDVQAGAEYKCAPLRKWKSEVRRGITRMSYADWAAATVIEKLGRTPPVIAPVAGLAPPR